MSKQPDLQSNVSKMLRCSFTILLVLFVKVDSKLYANELERIVEDASRAYQEMILSESYVASANILAKARCDGQYCMFEEGKGYLHSSGYNAPIAVANFDFLPVTFYKSDRDSLWKETIVWSQREIPGFKYHSDVPFGLQSLISAYRFSEKNGPFYKPDYFEFERLTNDQESGAIQLGFSSIRNTNYKGVIILNESSMLPNKVIWERLPFYSQNFQRWIIGSGEVIYDIKDGRLYVSEVSFEVVRDELEYSIKLKSGEPFEIGRTVSEMDFMLLQGITQNPYVEPIEADGFIFSSSFSEIDLNKLRRDLEGEIPLEKQFIRNSGTWYMYRINQQDRKVSITQEDASRTLLNDLIRYFNSIKRKQKGEILKLNNSAELFPSRFFNAGVVTPGETINAVFEFVNSGSNELRILSLRPDCGILSYGVSKDKIKSGNSGEVFFSIKAPYVTGEIRGEMIVEANTKIKLYNLVITAEVHSK